MKVSEKLTNLRRENNLTQAELAEKMKVSRQAISRWEVGAAVPSIENLTYLGSFYNVPLEYFLDDNAQEPTRIGSDAPNIENEDRLKKEKGKGKGLLVLIAIAIVIVIEILAAAFFAKAFLNRDQDNGAIPIEEMEEDKVDMSTEGDFDFEW